MSQADMVRQQLQNQELMNINIEIFTYRKPLVGKESRLESGMQNLSIHTQKNRVQSMGNSQASIALASAIE